eukprot:TRINITY_DN56473_c0_g1_i1.p1 TRINITY_DN56473_c0_g1~~TRINITY_DN56473_c0_g1_i1.p1  ORF type:complete len:116 (-),score=21.17 TRINITY_DN56473_c0_g1_i1:298-621(-)
MEATTHGAFETEERWVEQKRTTRLPSCDDELSDVAKADAGFSPQPLGSATVAAARDRGISKDRSVRCTRRAVTDVNHERTQNAFAKEEDEQGSSKWAAKGFFARRAR